MAAEIISGVVTFTLAEQCRPVRAAYSPAPTYPAPQPTVARPIVNPDWDALIAETRVEWRETLDYLGK